MPPLGSTRERPFGIYTVLMIVAAAFLFLAIVVTYIELDSEYWGAGGYMAEDDDDGEFMPEVDAADEE
jgi:hypothetical protein